MRVLYVYKDYYPVFGGIENHIQLLAEGLRARGVDAQVLVTNTSRHTVHEMINGVPVTKTGRIAQISSAPISPSFYSNLARLSRGADITHLHFPYPPAEIGQLLVGRGKHFVLTYHSDIVRQKVLGFVYRPLLRRVLRQAEAIVVSNLPFVSTSRYLQPVAYKCREIPYGLDLARFELTPAIQARAQTIRNAHGTPLILAVGKFRHYKGFDVLIEAMCRIKDAHTLIVGTGPLEADWKHKAEALGVTDRVFFLGELPESELVAHYHAADVFAFPSTNRAEMWGLAQVEAMACGLPVVCTELGTATSFVNQDRVTGLVIPPREPQALAAALQRLLGDEPLRRAMGAAGKERAHRLFSLNSMIDRMTSLYSDVMEGRVARC